MLFPSINVKKEVFPPNGQNWIFDNLVPVHHASNFFFFFNFIYYTLDVFIFFLFITVNLFVPIDVLDLKSGIYFSLQL